jgi:hypothetical protein
MVTAAQDKVKFWDLSISADVTLESLVQEKIIPYESQPAHSPSLLSSSEDQLWW